MKPSLSSQIVGLSLQFEPYHIHYRWNDKVNACLYAEESLRNKLPDYR